MQRDNRTRTDTNAREVKLGPARGPVRVSQGRREEEGGARQDRLQHAVHRGGHADDALRRRVEVIGGEYWQTNGRVAAPAAEHDRFQQAAHGPNQQ